MPLACNENDKTQGHCWAPAQLQAQNGSNVFIEGARAIGVGDITQHPGSCTSPPTTHPITSIAGSPTIFIGSVALVRDGDPMNCGDAAETGGRTVFADGGGNAAQLGVSSQDPTFNVEETVGYVVTDINTSYNFKLLGKVRRVNTAAGSTPVYKEYWKNWRSQAYQPHPSEGFRITVQEEFTGRNFISRQYEGAPNIPNTAPEYYQNPLDPYVFYEVLQGPFTVDSDGILYLDQGYVPPKNENGNLFIRKITVVVKITYGFPGSTLFKDVPFDVNFVLTTGEQPL